MVSIMSSISRRRSSSTRSIFLLTRRSLGSGKVMIGLRAMGDFVRGALGLIIGWTAAVKRVLILFLADSLKAAVMAGLVPAIYAVRRDAIVLKGGGLGRVSYCTKPVDPRVAATGMAGTSPAMAQRASTRHE